MTIRTTLSSSTRTARTTASRATIREVDDNNLMQEVKQADVFHSETPSNFERWQMVGMTSVPLKQKEEQQQKNSSQKSDMPGDWNHDQPKGEAAEAVMLYLNGSRSHPVAIADDRRVRPYGMKEGEGAHYASDGSEQMSFVNEKGYYVVSLDGPSVASKDKKTRMASLRHVNKKMQSHDGKKVKDEKDYKHEGDSVNTEVRSTKDKIEMFAPGEKRVGLYDKAAKRWFFDVDAAGNVTLEMTSSGLTLKAFGSTVTMTSAGIKLVGTRIDHN